MSKIQNSDILCCISTWHRDSNGLNFYDEETKDPKILYPWNTSMRLPIGPVSCIDRINERENFINSGPIGRYKFKNYLENNLQVGNINVVNMSNVFRLLSEWRKNNELKNDFVMELIDFIKLCGIKKNLAYKDLFDLLSKIFRSKLKTKKIVDDATYAKFDELALKCVRMINIPHLIDSVILLLSKFNRLSNKVIKELTTPDLYLFPRFLDFYKLAPIKLRQQMWLKRPRWFVYEILPLIMLFKKLFFNSDCYSILNMNNNKESSPRYTFFNEIKDLLKFIKINGTKVDSSIFKEEVDSYLEDYFENKRSCDLSSNEFVQQSDSSDSIFSFVSRIQALYTSCVELEHEEIEIFGESCKCLAFNFMDSAEFYKSFIQLQKSELFSPINGIDIPVINCNNYTFTTHQVTVNSNKNNVTTKTEAFVSNNSNLQNVTFNQKNINKLSNSTTSIYNLNICGNILNLGRIVAYISYCIGNYKELYMYFVNTIKQLYIDSLFHNIGNYNIQNDCFSDLKSISIAGIHSETLDPEINIETNNMYSELNFNKHKLSSNNDIDLIKSISNNNLSNKFEKIKKDDIKKDDLNTSKNEQLQNSNFEAISSEKDKFQYQFEQKLSDFSGDSSLSTLRIFVALRIFHFDNKVSRSDEEERKGIVENEKSVAIFNKDINIEKNFTETSKNDYNYSLTIPECDPIIWPCIHIVGNILKDGFSSNKSQELLINISSTLIIKSRDELAEISFIFSEPHFLFICSEFIIETSILTMFRSSMDALLVLNPQRRKIPIALISLGLNSPYLSYISRISLLNNSNFLYNSSNTTLNNSVATSSMVSNSQISVSCSGQTLSPFGKSSIADSSVLINSYSSNPRKRSRKTAVSDTVSLIQIPCPLNQQNTNFAIRFDILLNLLTSFNNNNLEDQFNENSNTLISTNSMPSIEQEVNNSNSMFLASINNQISSTILSNVNKLQNTVFHTFLPLIDRYLELSISSQKTNISKFNLNNETQNKSKRNESLKTIRNELKEYINSILNQKKHNYTNNLTLKFIRLIATSLFFTGVKPTLNRLENQNNSFYSNISGLFYIHIHNSNFKNELNSKLRNNQLVVPSLPSCINLSIRLLEMSFCSDWLNQMFLKTILGLLYTYPKLSNKFEKNNLINGVENNDVEKTNKISNSSLLAFIPNDIIQGLIFRIVLPSIRDPLIASSEINVIYEIMSNKEILLLLDNKVKKLCIERFWIRNPFQFKISTLNEKNVSISEPQKIHIKDLYHNIFNSINDLKSIEEIYLDVPYKKMLWEHHFISDNDAYFVFFKWLVHFLTLCTHFEKENPFFNKILLINNLLKKFYRARSRELIKN